MFQIQPLAPLLSFCGSGKCELEMFAYDELKGISQMTHFRTALGMIVVGFCLTAASPVVHAQDDDDDRHRRAQNAEDYDRVDDREFATQEVAQYILSKDSRPDRVHWNISPDKSRDAKLSPAHARAGTKLQAQSRCEHLASTCMRGHHIAGPGDPAKVV